MVFDILKIDNKGEINNEDIEVYFRGVSTFNFLVQGIQNSINLSANFSKNFVRPDNISFRGLI